MGVCERDAARVYEIRAAIKALQEEEATLLAEFKALDYDDYAAGPFKVSVRPNRRFDPTLAEGLLTDAQKRKVTKRIVDGTLLKAHYPDLYPAAQREYAPKVNIDLMED